MHTYTAASVYGGLVSAANFARVAKKQARKLLPRRPRKSNLQSSSICMIKNRTFYKSVEIDESKGVISKIQPVIFQVFMEFLLSGSSGR